MSFSLSSWSKAPLAMAAALALTLPLTSLAQTAANTQRSVAIAIAAQPLGEALNQLAASTSTPIAYSPALVAGKTAPAVHGELTVLQALAQMLAGSGLEYRQESGSIVIRAAAPRATSANSDTLPEVVVTGSAYQDASSEGTQSYQARAVTLGKTEQTLREIPQSVSVMTRQQIDDQQLTSLGDALAYMPGVTVARADEDSARTRGYKAQVQLSGVAQASGSPDDYSVNDLETFDRVEVLRGPAGLLAGRGEPGGAVNYERKRPKQDFGFSASASLGSWHTYRNTFDVTGPMNKEGNLRGRLVTVVQDGDSFINTVTDKRRVIYGIVEVDLTPQTLLGLSVLNEKRDYISTFAGLSTYTDGGMPSRGSFIGTDTPTKLDKKEYKFDLTHRFANGWAAKAIGYRLVQGSDSHYGIVTSQIDRSTGLADLNIRRTSMWQTYQGLDVNLAGPIELFGKTHTALFGYQWLSYKYNNQYDDGSGLQRGVDVLNQHSFPITPLEEYVGNERAKEPSFYGVVRFKLHDQLTAIVGGSLTDYRYENYNNGRWNTDDAKVDNQFTPYAGLVWEVNPSTSLYASYAEIFQSQYGRDYLGSVLPPRTGEQFEVGIKQGFLDDRLNLAVAVFRIQDTNRSIVDPDNVGCGSNGVCNKAAGMIESKGIDTEIVGSPLPGWNLATGYTYNDVRYKKGTNMGERFQPALTPQHSFKFWSSYDLGYGVAGWELPGWSIGAGLRGQSATYANHWRQGTHAIYSATVGYRMNKHLRANFTVDNLFDKNYLSNLGTVRLQNYYGEPRKFTVSLRTEF